MLATRDATLSTRPATPLAAATTPIPTDTATVTSASTSTSTPTMTTAPPPTPPVCYQPPGWGDPSTWESYTVRPDDNLVALAITYRTTYQDILGANCLHSLHDFVPGLRLLLPRLTQPLPSSMTTRKRLPTASYPPVRTWAVPTLVPWPGPMPTPSQSKATRLPPPAATGSAYVRPAANGALPSSANTGPRTPSPRRHQRSSLLRFSLLPRSLGAQAI